MTKKKLIVMTFKTACSQTCFSFQGLLAVKRNYPNKRPLLWFCVEIVWKQLKNRNAGMHASLTVTQLECILHVEILACRSLRFYIFCSLILPSAKPLKLYSWISTSDFMTIWHHLSHKYRRRNSFFASVFLYRFHYSPGLAL